MQIRPTALKIGLIIYFSIVLFHVYTEFGIDSIQKKGSPVTQNEIVLIIVIVDFFDVHYNSAFGLLFRANNGNIAFSEKISTLLSRKVLILRD